MAIRLYDEALVSKINKWVKDPNLRILKPDESTRLFQMYADKNNDKPLKLPIISISRNSEIEILNTQKQPMTFDGVNLITKQKVSIPLNAIPIRLGYQIDIYTRHMEEVDEYIRNFVFNIINYPKLKVVIPYNDANIEHLSNIRIESSIIDNSDIAEHLFADQFYRFTLKINVDDAYLFSIPFKDSYRLESIEFEVEDIDDREIVEKETIINENEKDSTK